VASAAAQRRTAELAFARRCEPRPIHRPALNAPRARSAKEVIDLSLLGAIGHLLGGALQGSVNIDGKRVPLTPEAVRKVAESKGAEQAKGE